MPSRVEHDLVVSTFTMKKLILAFNMVTVLFLLEGDNMVSELYNL